MNARVVLPFALLAASKSLAESEACGATMASTDDFDSNLIQVTAAARPQFDSVGFTNSSKSGVSTTVSDACGAGYELHGYPTPDDTTGYYSCLNWDAGTGSPPTTLHTVSAGTAGVQECKALCDADSTCTYFTKYGAYCDPCHSSWETRCYLIRQCGGLPHVRQVSQPFGAVTCEKQATTPASATGDPHLQNIHGERFDLMKQGKHVLINVPRGESAEHTLLRVQADARQLGGQCADMYFQELNVTGSWAEAKRTGGYHYDVTESADKTPQWIGFGKIELKVTHGRTDIGLRYLNVFAKHLGRAGFAVGGLLGEDDHEDVSAPRAECVNHMSLKKIRARTYSRISSAASTAEGAFD